MFNIALMAIEMCLHIYTSKANNVQDKSILKFEKN